MTGYLADGASGKRTHGILVAHEVLALMLRHWGHRIFVSHAWPAQPIRRGEMVIGGYPEARRSRTSEPSPRADVEGAAVERGELTGGLRHKRIKHAHAGGRPPRCAHASATGSSTPSTRLPSPSRMRTNHRSRSRAC
jgi:hypothetical protein